MGLFNSIRLGSSAAGDYEVERSLRWDGGTGTNAPQLKRTGSSTSSSYTVSMWFKYTGVGNSLINLLFSLGQSNDSDSAFMGINTNDNFVVYNNGGYEFTSSRKFRDPSAWYHFTMSVNSNSYTLYINNESLDTGTLRSLDTSSDGLRIGVQYGNYYPFAGYIADFYLIDGSALTPASFAKTDPITGQWIPKKYSGSFGTSGAYLLFDDNSDTTATTLGKDSSGNSNNFTPSNFSVAAGVGNDSLEDTPTNNFCTLNPLAGNGTNFSTISNGNLNFSCASGTGQRSHGSMLIPETGKWYAEAVFSSGGQHSSFGVVNPVDGSSLVNLEFSTSQEQIRADNSYLESSTESWGNGEILGIKVDRDAGTIQFTVDGTNASTAVNLSEMSNTSQLVFTTSRTEGGGAAVAGSFNFGQRPFSHLPTGYKSLCTANLPDPSVKIPTNHFNTLLYSGDGNATKSITGVGFQPDLLWLKGRNSTYSHLLYNSVRGAGLQKGLNSNETRAEGSTVGDNATYGYVNSFDSDGFSVTKGSDSTSYTNGGSTNYVAWNWYAGGSTATNNDGSRTAQVRANTTAGFSIVTSTSGGSSSGTYDSFGHGLGVAPDIIIFKNRDIVDNWSIYNSNFSTAYSKILQFNTIDETTSTNHWGTANPTSTTFSVNQGAVFTGADQNFIAYCFSEVAGFSKFGKYTGNNNANGAFVYLGFRPALVIIKRLEAGYSWYMLDNKRDPINPVHENLYANSGIATYDYSMGDLLSNGFKLRNTGTDSNKVDTHIYLAFAESPFKYARAR